MGKGRTEMEVRGDGVALITIVHPPLNCLSFDVLFGLKDHFEEALARDDVKAIVLTGENAQFCGGFDLTELDSIVEGEDEEPNDGYLSINIITDIFEGAAKPCVAAVDGLTIGGGLEIAMACHARISTSTTVQLGLPELKIGIIPGLGGTQRLPRLVGIVRALEMLLSSELVNGEEALASGLVDAVAEAEELVEEACRWAVDMAESRRAWVRTLEKMERIEPLQETLEFLALARSLHHLASSPHHLPTTCIDVILEGFLSGPRAGLLREAITSKALLFSDPAKQLIADILKGNVLQKMASLET